MLGLARAVAGTATGDRMILIEGTAFNAPPGPFNAATCILVLGLIPDDGSKLSTLEEVRAVRSLARRSSSWISALTFQRPTLCAGWSVTGNTPFGQAFPPTPSRRRRRRSVPPLPWRRSDGTLSCSGNPAFAMSSCSVRAWLGGAGSLTFKNLRPGIRG